MDQLPDGPLDPDVPKIREQLRRLQRLVKRKKVTPQQANAALGAYADGLLRSKVHRLPWRGW